MIFEESTKDILDKIKGIKTELDDFNYFLKKKTRTIGTRIFVCDDDEIDRELIKRTLQKAGYRTVCTGSSKELIEMIKVNDIGLLITDIFLPEINGCEVIESLSSYNIPCIAMSGVDESYPEVQKLKEMKVPFLKKPVDKDIVLTIVFDLFGKPIDTREVPR